MNLFNRLMKRQLRRALRGHKLAVKVAKPSVKAKPAQAAAIVSMCGYKGGKS